MSNWSCTNFAIGRTRHGRPIREKKPTSSSYKFVASAANLATEILFSLKGQDAMVRMAFAYDDWLKLNQRPRWYGGFGDNRQKVQNWVKKFLDSIHTEFPLIVINDDLRSTLNGASVHRYLWEGQIWKPRSFTVFINGDVSPKLDDGFNSLLTTCSTQNL